MQGNEACTIGALVAGLEFYAGYPITPSTEIAELCSEELPKVGGKFVQMEDEIGSIAAIIGASLTGKKTMTATSGPGFSLMQECLGYASETEVPIVIINCQRMGPSTGMPTSPAQGEVMQARWGTHGDHPVIVLAPGNVMECFDLTVRAFNLAEKYRVPVIVLTDEVIGHMREKVEVPDVGSFPIINRKRPSCDTSEFMAYRPDPEDNLPPMASFGDGYRWHITGLTHNEWGFPTNCPEEIAKKNARLMDKVNAYRDDIVEFETESVEDAKVIVLAYGSVARTALSAVRQARAKGMKVGYFRPITLWPFPDREIEMLAAKAGSVIVPELNFGQMIHEVDRAIHGKAEVFQMSLVNGELFQPSEILEKIEEVAR